MNIIYMFREYENLTNQLAGLSNQIFDMYQSDIDNGNREYRIIIHKNFGTRTLYLVHLHHKLPKILSYYKNEKHFEFYDLCFDDNFNDTDENAFYSWLVTLNNDYFKMRL